MERGVTAGGAGGGGPPPGGRGAICQFVQKVAGAAGTGLGGSQALLQYLLRLELVELQIPTGGLHQRFLRDQADQFAVMDAHAVAFGLAAD